MVTTVSTVGTLTCRLTVGRISTSREVLRWRPRSVAGHWGISVRLAGTDPRFPRDERPRGVTTKLLPGTCRYAWGVATGVTAGVLDRGLSKLICRWRRSRMPRTSWRRGPKGPTPSRSRSLSWRLRSTDPLISSRIKTKPRSSRRPRSPTAQCATCSGPHFSMSSGNAMSSGSDCNDRNWFASFGQTAVTGSIGSFSCPPLLGVWVCSL